MSETKRDYRSATASRRAAGHSRRASPATRGPRGMNLSALLIAALNEPAYVTIDRKRRKITKRELG